MFIPDIPSVGHRLFVFLHYMYKTLLVPVCLLYLHGHIDSFTAKAPAKELRLMHTQFCDA